MRKIRMFGLMLVAICALGAPFVALASAETTKFLVDGVVPAVATASITEDETLFENLRTSNDTFLCSGILEGTIPAGGALYEVTKVLNLSKEGFESDATATIACAPDPSSICSKVAVSPVDLPWDYDPVLASTENDFLLLGLANANGSLPAYFVLCEVLGLDLTELCEPLPETAQLVENGVTDVLFPAESKPTPDSHCPGDGATEESTGLVVDEALQFVAGKTLAISE